MPIQPTAGQAHSTVIEVTHNRDTHHAWCELRSLLQSESSLVFELLGFVNEPACRSRKKFLAIPC